MENNLKMTPRDFFMHLLGFVALYASIISFLTLMYQYVNVLFPDPLNFYYTRILNIIRVASSTLIVVFLVFILINWLLERDFAKAPKKRDLKFRKWLIYFTLFVSAITIIIDLIRLVYIFYSGELTTRFLLKILAVLIVAAGVLAYYFWDLKRDTEKKYKLPRIALWVSVIVVLAGIVSGFFIVGTPAEQRLRRFDDQRVSDLQEIQNQIIYYWQQKDVLPSKLTDLNDSISGFVVPTDPATGADYIYNIQGELDFELCANFDKVSLAEGRNTYPRQPGIYYPGAYQENWSHEAGEKCFSRIIDPELYDNTLKIAE